MTDAGAVLVSAANPDPGLPSTGEIHLGGLLPTVAPLADLDVDIGAVAASSVLDACPFTLMAAREYGIASVELVESGEAVSTLYQTIVDAVDVVQTTVNALETTLLTLVRSLLLVLSLLVQVEVDLHVDLQAALAPVLSGLRRDAEGIVTLDLQAGEIRVDLANLLGGPYGLNGRPPNTELLDDVFFQSLLPKVTGIVTDLLTELVDDVVSTVQATLDNTSLLIGASLLGLPILSIGGTLSDLDLTLLGIDLSLVGDVLGAVVGLVTSTVTGAVDTLTTTLNGAVASVGAVLDAALRALDVVSLMVNVQPDQPGAPPGTVVPDGMAQVTALRLGVLPVLSANTYVTLATASAGPNAAHWTSS